MTNHTEGPWKVEKYSDQNVRDAERIRSADGLIVVPEVWGNSLDSCDANYRLIAAAPELLEAAKAASLTLQGMTVFMEIIKEYDAEYGPTVLVKQAMDRYLEINMQHERMDAAIAKAEGRQ